MTTNEFNFDQILKDFLDALKHTQALEDTEARHEHLKSTVTAKQAQFSKPTELSEIKSILDLAFRLFLVELLDAWTKQDIDVPEKEVDKLVELALWSAHHELVEASLVLSLFEDLFDSQTIDKCQSLFSILESRAPSLAHDMFVQEKTTARNILLRVCTTLLKRLSKTNNAEFCGRILIFLAYVFPLSDRSGLNVKSECNVANVTIAEDVPTSTTTTTSTADGEPATENGDKMQVDKPDEIPDDSTDGPVDYGFYHTFWSLHAYFQNFQILFLHPEKWPTFVKGVELVLAAFAGNSNLEDVVQQQNHYFTKYLTSSNLIKLQLKDSSFRRHILVQLLILFQALNTPVLKQSTQVLKDKQRQTVFELTEKVKELLQGTQPKGPQFTRTVLDILQRENNWILWKRENCKGFEKSSSSVQSVQGPKRAAANVAGGKVKKVKMGNAELSRLWNLSSDNHEVLVNSARAPTLDEYLKPLDDRPTLLKDDKIFAWKGLRLIARTRFRYFTELSDKKMGNMEDLYAIIERDKKGATPTTNGSHPEEMLKKNDLSISNELDMENANHNASSPASPTLSSTPASTTTDGKEDGKEKEGEKEGKEGEKEGEKEGKEEGKEGVKVKAEPNKDDAEHPPKRIKKDLSPVPNKE
eukprot:Phypoly_transcript_01814.p1 GENE.Phypoly_transcript_01814~~Phypoly_transcript_01814.p1  ORF type:complete len:641 (-),score=169.30 Phypoly_transcript_01814:60-1982(-)